MLLWQQFFTAQSTAVPRLSSPSSAGYNVDDFRRHFVQHTSFSSSDIFHTEFKGVESYCQNVEKVVSNYIKCCNFCCHFSRFHRTMKYRYHFTVSYNVSNNWSSSSLLVRQQLSKSAAIHFRATV